MKTENGTSLIFSSVALGSIIMLVAFIIFHHFANLPKHSFTEEIAIQEDTPILTIEIDSILEIVITPLDFSVYEQKSNELSKEEINQNVEQELNLPSGILESVHFIETSNRCHVRSRVGANGCFQIMPQTQSHIEKLFGIEVDPFDYESSAVAAGLYLNHLKERKDRLYPNLSDEVRWGLALASYNAGPTNGMRWAREASKKNIKTTKQLKSIISFNETRHYVDTITSDVFGIQHYVERGDSVYRIARKYNINPTIILAEVGETIYAGQIITIRK